MKLFNKILLSAVAAMGATSAAHAAPAPAPLVTYVPMDLGAPGVFTDTWSFSGGGTGAVAGKTFDDVFLFNVTDTPNISFVASSTVTNGVTGVNFLGGAYAVYAWSDGTLYDLRAANLPGSVSGGIYSLSTGEYALEIAGTYVANGGSFSGVITGMPVAAAVPEPTSWLMMLAGLTAVAGVARRRKNTV